MLYEILDTVVLDYYKAEDNRYADMIIGSIVSDIVSDVCTKLLESD